MAWKNASLCLLGALLSFNVQANEPLWWVTSEESPTVVPLYGGEPNPFPTRAEPPPPVQPKLDEEATIVGLSEDELRSAALLEDIRKMLASEQILTPNIFTIKIAGYLDANRAPKVLINGRWLGVGDEVRVSVTTAQKFEEMVEELKQLDRELFRTISEDIQGKMALAENYLLTITDIRPDAVTFSDLADEKHVISYTGVGL
jgi:hypothetical protein